LLIYQPPGECRHQRLTSETVSSITAAGVASGVYAGLIAADMSNWGNSYHTEFLGWGTYSPAFSAFELGTGWTGGPEVVTIGTTAGAIPEPARCCF